jgi:hypothetical protein
MSPEASARLALRELASLVENQADVLSKIAQSVGQCLTEIPPGVAPDPYRLAYLAVELSRYYTAFEHIVETVERTLGEPPPKSDRWHRDLLELAARERPQVRPPLVGPDTSSRLHELLGFRHFLRNAYAVELRWPAHLERHAAGLASLHDALVRDLRAFSAHLRAAANALEE